MLARYLDTNGDGTGTKEATGNYSAAAAEFYIKPSPTKVLVISQLLVFISDTLIHADNYGNITGGLTNGIKVETRNDDGLLIDLLDGVLVKKTADWGAVCRDVTHYSWGDLEAFATARWLFSESGTPVTLYGDGRKSEAAPPGHRLVVTVNDDLTGLLGHRFQVQGQFS